MTIKDSINTILGRQEAKFKCYKDIKTFGDACRKLDFSESDFDAAYQNIPNHVKAYFRLTVIVAALNDGWKPRFTADEYRYFPWFEFITKEDFDQMDEEDKKCVVGRASSNANAGGGYVSASAHVASSSSYADSGARLAFKTRELAEYAGKQFIEEYADYMLM